MNNRRNWSIVDPDANVELTDIPVLARRARALVCRSPSPVLDRAFVQVWGAVSMLLAMHYHCARFLEGLQESEGTYPRDLMIPRNEAVAWLNRLGQFHYFTSSELVTSADNIPSTPTIDSILPFRHKHAAHRSLDAPRKDDTPELQISQAIALSELSGSYWIPRNGVLDASALPSFNTHYFAFQIRDTTESRKTFNLEVDHDKVMLEGYKVIESLLQSGDA
jgi:hypothetical protein